MNSFYTAFDETISALLGEKIGCTIDEIENTFIYASNALEITDKLYKLKETLLQQLLEYAKQPENSDKIGIQYHKKDDNETKDVLYVYLAGTFMPLSFHMEIDNLDGIEGFSPVNEKVQTYFNGKKDSKKQKRKLCKFYNASIKKR